MTAGHWVITWPADENVAVRYWHPVRGWRHDASEAMRFGREQDAVTYVIAHLMQHSRLLETIEYAVTRKEPNQ